MKVMLSRRSMIAFLSVIIVIAIVAALVFATSKGYDTLTIPPLRIAKATPSIPFEDITFPARGKTYQVYAYYLAGEVGYPALIHVHGRFGSRHQKEVLERAEVWHSLGYSVLSLDLSDSGGDTVEDGRSSMGLKEQYDVLGAFDYLVARGFAADQIGIVSISLGAATSLLAAGQEPRIKAVWEDSGYSRADSAIAEQAWNQGYTPLLVPIGFVWAYLVTGDRLWEVTPINLGPTFAKHNQAVYVVHGQGDTAVEYHHGVDLYTAYKAAGVEVTFWDLPQTSHGDIYVEHTEEYIRRMDEFFKSTLSFTK
jgi:uncharacterized protein